MESECCRRLKARSHQCAGRSGRPTIRPRPFLEEHKSWLAGRTLMPLISCVRPLRWIAVQNLTLILAAPQVSVGQWQRA